MLDTLYNPARCACGAPMPPPLAGMATNGEGEGDAARFWIFVFKSEDVGAGRRCLVFLMLFIEDKRATHGCACARWDVTHEWRPQHA